MIVKYCTGWTLYGVACSYAVCQIIFRTFPGWTGWVALAMCVVGMVCHWSAYREEDRLFHQFLAAAMMQNSRCPRDCAACRESESRDPAAEGGAVSP